MDEWDDPLELRIRLDLALERIAVFEGELADLRAADGSVRAQRMLSNHEASAASSILQRLRPAGPGRLVVDQSSSPEAKLELFRELFAGRQDVYALRWTSAKSGKFGWSPTERDPFGARERPQDEREFLPLTDEMLTRHLARTAPGARQVHIGLYPMLSDDTCRLLVCDFDHAEWQADAVAFHAACAGAGVPAALEVSRSGQGAHVWLFFTGPVTAGTARALGFGILRRAIAARGQMRLSSYDHFFPAQDLLPVNARGGQRFGNLIALPLQGDCRATGTTVFCDPATLAPHADQFAFLSGLQRLTPDQVAELAAQLGEAATGPRPSTGSAAGLLPAKPRRGALGRAPRLVPARMRAMLEISTQDLPAPLIAALKHAASLHNPDFYRRQAQRYSTFATPRFVYCFDDTDPRVLRLPRGLADEAADLVRAAGGSLEITYDVGEGESIKIGFAGDLTPIQQAAVAAMAEHEAGVLVAPPGAGKTVMACALIARHAVPTAIVVDRRELLEQWRERLDAFLDLPPAAIGVIGAGKNRRTGVVDLVMLPTLARRAPESPLDRYGLVVVDECHGLGAPAAYAAISHARVARWIGLSATPYRADNLDGLITFACGPVRHSIEPAPTVPQAPGHARDRVHDPGERHGRPLHPGDLRGTGRRLRPQPADRRPHPRRRETGRRILVLSNRIGHLDALAADLRAAGLEPLVLHGRLSPAERRAARRQLAEQAGAPHILLAIDKIASEGLDLPHLDTLVLASPAAFKGRVVQQVGRIQRTHARKTSIEVHDYLDAEVPVLARMHARRRRTLTRPGFAPRSPDQLDTSASTSGDSSTTTLAAHRIATAATAEASARAPASADSRLIRTWARANGYQVADRGRISTEFRAAFERVCDARLRVQTVTESSSPIEQS